MYNMHTFCLSNYEIKFLTRSANVFASLKESEMNFHFIRYLWNLWQRDIKHSPCFMNTVWNEKFISDPILMAYGDLWKGSCSKYRYFTILFNNCRKTLPNPFSMVFHFQDNSRQSVGRSEVKRPGHSEEIQRKISRWKLYGASKEMNRIRTNFGPVISTLDILCIVENLTSRQVLSENNSVEPAIRLSKTAPAESHCYNFFLNA